MASSVAWFKHKTDFSLERDFANEDSKDCLKLKEVVCLPSNFLVHVGNTCEYVHTYACRASQNTTIKLFNTTQQPHSLCTTFNAAQIRE